MSSTALPTSTPVPASKETSPRNFSLTIPGPDTAIEIYSLFNLVCGSVRFLPSKCTSSTLPKLNDSCTEFV